MQAELENTFLVTTVPVHSAATRRIARRGAQARCLTDAPDQLAVRFADVERDAPPLLPPPPAPARGIPAPPGAADPLTTLPEAVARCIFLWLPRLDCGACLGVNHRWRQLLDNDDARWAWFLATKQPFRMNDLAARQRELAARRAAMRAQSTIALRRAQLDRALVAFELPPGAFRLHVLSKAFLQGTGEPRSAAQTAAYLLLGARLGVRVDTIDCAFVELCYRLDSLHDGAGKITCGCHHCEEEGWSPPQTWATTVVAMLRCLS